MLHMVAILQHLDLLERNKPAQHHLVELRQKRLDFLLGVDDLDDEGQVLGEPQDLRRVKRLVCPKPIGPRSTVAPAR